MGSHLEGPPSYLYERSADWARAFSRFKEPESFDEQRILPAAGPPRDWWCRRLASVEFERGECSVDSWRTRIYPAARSQSLNPAIFFKRASPIQAASYSVSASPWETPAGLFEAPWTSEAAFPRRLHIRLVFARWYAVIGFFLRADPGTRGRPAL